MKTQRNGPKLKDQLVPHYYMLAVKEKISHYNVEDFAKYVRPLDEVYYMAIALNMWMISKNALQV